MNSAVPSAAMRPTVSSASPQTNRVGTRVGPIDARSPRARYHASAASMADGLPITDKCFFDGFAGNAVARQTVPNPLPVFGEQPLPGVRVEQFPVMARPVRLLEIDLQRARERCGMRARQHGQRRDPLRPAIGDDPGEAAAPIM